MYTEFNKDMLKPGMLIESRDGFLYKLGVNPNIYYDDCGQYQLILVTRAGMYLCLNNFADNLTYENNKNKFDIVKVYAPVETKHNFSFDVAEHTLIWERKEDTTFELTMQEIADKFNVNVKTYVLRSNK